VLLLHPAVYTTKVLWYAQKYIIYKIVMWHVWFEYSLYAHTWYYNVHIPTLWIYNYYKCQQYEQNKTAHFSFKNKPE